MNLYITEKNWQKWLIPAAGVDLKNVNIVLLSRMAAYVRDVVKKPIYIGAGVRSQTAQSILYKKWIVWRTWLQTKKGIQPVKANLAAAPGTSWHEFGYAIDVNSVNGVYPGTITQDYKMYQTAPEKCALRKYGLIQPVIGEQWHIQLVETKGVKDKKGFKL
jgi:hypothetical protein